MELAWLEGRWGMGLGVCGCGVVVLVPQNFGVFSVFMCECCFLVVCECLLACVF